MSKINVTPNGFVFIKNNDESVSFFFTETNFYISIKKLKKESIIEYDKSDLFLFKHMLNSFLGDFQVNSNYVDIKFDKMCKEIKDLINKKDTV